MRFFVFLVSFFSFIQFSVFSNEIKPLYQLPDETSSRSQFEKTVDRNKIFLTGGNAGLYKIAQSHAIPLWTLGKVEQIASAHFPAEKNKTNDVWYFRTSLGILYSEDLEHFELRNNGIAPLVIKKFANEKLTLENRSPFLKDLAIDPINQNQLVTATESAVFITSDGGAHWKSIYSPSLQTPGIKAVAIATIENVTYVFASHTIFGFSYCTPFEKNKKWHDAPRGIKMMPSLSSPDEVADIYPILQKNEDGTDRVEIYFSQTYLPRIYRFNLETKKSELIHEENAFAGTIDGLTSIDGVLLFSKNETLGSFNLETKKTNGLPKNFATWKKSFLATPGSVETAWIPKSKTNFSDGVLLNELWLLYPGTVNSLYGKIAEGKKGLYMPANRGSEKTGIAKFRKIIKDNNLNALVIDMKDDYGLLRYHSKDELVKEKGRSSQYAIDLEYFVSQFKEDNVYLIARIVVFKDRNLSRFANGKYAVWDSRLKKNWVGVKDYQDVFDENGNATGEKKSIYYDENWVDPYCYDVWEYNVAVAKELIARGFDEIQFDYIRFPTDGINLGNARYRYKEKGMTKESALLSFLSYARENIAAPIGIDIYGANGWYRSGTRTGQDAQTLAEYVDVISAMFYPSHFENAFMNYAPFEERPYRIYYYGNYRTTIMTRNRVVARPWVQAFRLNVSYDNRYYGVDYIKREIFGARDSANRGYLYWNNVGNYENLRPDISDSETYFGSSPEASAKKPAIGSEKNPDYVDETISILDSVLNQGKQTTNYTPFLFIPFSE